MRKTITLSDKSGDNPTVSICKGHVNTGEFNKAYKREGWKDSRITKSELTHEYWIEGKTKWKKSSITDHKAIAVTVLHW